MVLIMDIIRVKKLLEKLSISRSTLDRWVKNENFPKKIYIGKNTIAFDLDEIEKWLKNKSNQLSSSSPNDKSQNQKANRQD